MAVYTLAPVPGQPFLSDTGAIIPGGLLWTYLSGTSTPTPTYTVQDGSVPQTNPIVLDGFGRAPSEIYMQPGTIQKWVLETAAPIVGGIQTHGSVIRTYPTVAAVPTSSSAVDYPSQTAGEAIAAGQAVYLSDGSGGKTAGLWYRADATNTYSSTTNAVGMAPSAIASGATGTIRRYGSITGLSSLTVGAIYYIDSTPGSITATAPSNARTLGEADTTSSLVLQEIPTGVTVDAGICGGRLTGTAGSPVVDVTGATSIYFTPFHNNRIALFDGTNWNIRTFTEITIALTAFTASKPYDIFAYDNAGTVTIETLVWTDASTRATAIANQNGVPSKTGALTRRLLGTVYINSSGGQTDDSLTKRNISNVYNRVPRAIAVVDTTNSWTYSTNAFHQANASPANQAEVTASLAEHVVDLFLRASGANNNAAGTEGAIAIGYDSTTTPISGSLVGNLIVQVANIQTHSSCRAVHAPAVGRHTYVWLENGESAATWTWYGDNGGTTTQNGLSGTVMN